MKRIVHRADSTSSQGRERADSRTVIRGTWTSCHEPSLVEPVEQLGDARAAQPGEFDERLAITRARKEELGEHAEFVVAGGPDPANLFDDARQFHRIPHHKHEQASPHLLPSRRLGWDVVAHSVDCRGRPEGPGAPLSSLLKPVLRRESTSAAAPIATRMAPISPALVALDGPVAGRVLGPTVVVGSAPPDPAAVVVGAAVVGAAVVVGGGATVISRGEPVSTIAPPSSIAATLNTPLASAEA